MSQALHCIQYLKDSVWIDQTSIDIWLMHIWDTLPHPQAKYIPSIFIPPVEVGGRGSDPTELNKEIDRFRDLFEDLPPRGTPCPLETLVYVLNCGGKPGRIGNHFCVIVFAPTLGAIYLLGRVILKNHSNNNSQDWNSWQGSRIWSKVCKLMGWYGLPKMVLRTTDWKQNGYDCGPIACQVAQHILAKGLQIETTGQWKRPTMMACCHMLRLKMAEHIYQVITDGHKKYEAVRATCPEQLEKIYNTEDLTPLDISHEELQGRLEQSAIANPHSVQNNLQRAIQKCNACHQIFEEERLKSAAKEHPIPLQNESIKQASQRRQQAVLLGTQSTKNYVTGIPESHKEGDQDHQEHIYQDGQDFEAIENIGQREQIAPPRKRRFVDAGQARIGRFPRPKAAPELPARSHLYGLQLPFHRNFDDYEGGPSLEDLISTYDPHLPSQPSLIYICKQIMLTPAPFSLFKDYGYRLFPRFAQAFDLDMPVMVKEHLCPVGLSNPPNSITNYFSHTPKGRYGQDIRINDLLVVWCSSLRGRYIWTAKISIPILVLFLIPLVKSFILSIQRIPQDRFLISSKLTKL